VNVSLRDALTPATAAPLVWLADLASRDRAIGVEELPDGFEAERLQTAEASDMSRSSRWVAWEPSSSEDLDLYPATDTQPPTTPSSAMSRLSAPGSG